MPCSDPAGAGRGSAGDDASDVGLDGGQVVGEGLEALGAIEEVGQVGGQLGADADGLLHGVGELGRVGGGQADHGHLGIAAHLAGRGHTHRGVGVEDHAGLVVGEADLGTRILIAQFLGIVAAPEAALPLLCAARDDEGQLVAPRRQEGAA